jgi:integrase
MGGLLEIEDISNKIKKPKASGVTIEDVNEDQLKRLLAAIAADTNADARGIMLIALYSGMRRGELFKLKWQDVDFDRDFMMILLAAQGLDNDEIALRLIVRREVVSMWRKRIFEKRLAGLEERLRPGRPRVFPPRAGRSNQSSGM